MERLEEKWRLELSDLAELQKKALQLSTSIKMKPGKRGRRGGGKGKLLLL
ncbi:unnamed protein product [Amoebophrya sp. A25]|nr:unnamed protein product [Amoebophrya sp. A25]|eukprot:GSA25T00003305001.1